MSTQRIKKRIVFIVNPISGVSKKQGLENAVAKELDAGLFDYQLTYTEYAGHGAKLAADAVAAGVDIVVAVGGDGSVNEVAGQLAGTDVAMGIIPMGSGNGLANHLKIPLTPGKALAVINKHKIERIDTASVNKHFFVSIAGVGFDAMIARKFAGSKRRGFRTYLRLIFSEFIRYQPLNYTLEIDGKAWNRDALFISFANSDQFGYKTKIAPQACIHDGLLDVCVVGKPPLYRMPALAYLLFSNQIGKLKDVEIVKAKQIRIESPSKQFINLDGDPVELKGDLVVILDPLSLNVIIP
jgi:diacylglycerol kinase (ATP)